MSKGSRRKKAKARKIRKMQKKRQYMKSGDWLNAPIPDTNGSYE